MPFGRVPIFGSAASRSLIGSSVRRLVGCAPSAIPNEISNGLRGRLPKCATIMRNARCLLAAILLARPARASRLNSLTAECHVGASSKRSFSACRQTPQRLTGAACLPTSGVAFGSETEPEPRVPCAKIAAQSQADPINMLSPFNSDYLARCGAARLAINGLRGIAAIRGTERNAMQRPALALLLCFVVVANIDFVASIDLSGSGFGAFIRGYRLSQRASGSGSCSCSCRIE